MTYTLIPNGNPIPLSEVEDGALFEYNGTIALKSEYLADHGMIEAFIVGNGDRPTSFAGQGSGVLAGFVYRRPVLVVFVMG